jgi:hypothetical protein
MNGTASASTFWAQKSREVKISPAPTVAEPYRTTKPAAGAKHRLVFRSKLPATGGATIIDRSTGITNGTALSSTLKKTDWAESDDDDEFIASFSTQGPRSTALENEVAQKDACVGELTATVATQDVRIQQLEENLEEKVQQIANLVADAEDNHVIVEQLKNDNHKQFLYVQELVAEIDANTRRITELEIELDATCAHMRELETESESQAQVCNDGSKIIHMAKQAEAEADACNIKDFEIVPQTHTSSRLPSVDDDSQYTCSQPKHTVDDGHRWLFADTPVQSRPLGPAVNESKFPKLWSPDMQRKSVPVEKPKVLKIAIDTSKFVKKPVSLGRKIVSTTGTDFPSLTYGLSSRHRTRTDVVPNLDFSRDIRHMTHAQRVLFANGPEVTVALGTTKLVTLPKYILMQCSEKAHKHFKDNPNATSITFPAGCMDVDAATALLRWMDEMTYQGRVYSLTLDTDEKFDMKNLRICQAARVMGLSNTYVGHFTKVLCDRVRNNNFSVGFVSLICELAYPENDPIFECLANNLVNQQLSKSSKNLDDLEKVMVKYPFLKERIMKSEQHVKDASAREKRKGGNVRQSSKDRNGSMA